MAQSCEMVCPVSIDGEEFVLVQVAQDYRTADLVNLMKKLHEDGTTQTQLVRR